MPKLFLAPLCKILLLIDVMLTPKHMKGMRGTLIYNNSLSPKKDGMNIHARR